MRWNQFWIMFVVLLAWSCEPEKPETPTKGVLHVLIADAVAPTLTREVELFTAIYGKNGVTVTYDIVASDEAIRQFTTDSIRCIIVTRPMTDRERSFLSDHEADLAEIVLAYDAVAAVVHHSNPVEQIATPDLRNILNGTVRRWEQLTHARGMEGAIVVFCHDSSDLASYLDHRLMRGTKTAPDIRPTQSNLATLRSVAENRAAIGFADLDWLDSARVPAKVLEIAEPNVRADTTFPPPIESVGKFYSPHQAHVFRNYYPLKRGIRVYAKAPKGSLPSGFVAFLAGREGQRIFLQRNLVPGTQPVRLKPIEERPESNN